jgi:hypothetical protein
VRRPGAPGPPHLWLLLALLVPACGDRREPLPRDHGLVADPLPARPEGEAVGIGGPWPAGTWAADVTLTFTDRPSHGSEETGWARLRLTQTTTVTEGAARSHVAVSLRDAAGLGKDLVEDLDGLVYTFDHDAAGRRVAGSERFLEGEVPTHATALLDERLFAGFGGSEPWVPATPVRVGETWSFEPPKLRESLRALDLQFQGEGVSLPPPRVSGGARLEAVEG